MTQLHAETVLTESFPPQEAPHLGPMESLRYHIGIVDELPTHTPEAEDGWNARRRIVDAYGADILGSIAVPAVTSVESLDVADFASETASADILAYYKALNQTRDRMTAPQELWPRLRVVARNIIRRCVARLAAA